MTPPQTSAEILTAAAAVMRAEFGGLGTAIAVLEEKAAVLAARHDHCYRGGLHTHDGLAPHSHEVRADHLGVQKEPR